MPAQHHYVDKEPDLDEIDILDIRQSYEDASPEMIMSNCRKLEMKWCLVESKRTKDILDLNGMKDLGYAQLLLEIPDRVDERNSTSLVAMAEKAMQRQVEHVTSMLHRAKSLDITRALEKRDANDRRPNLTLHHRLNRLYKRIFRGFQNIRTHVGGIEDIACPGVIQGAYGADPDLFKPSTELYAPGIIEELSPFQRALYVCLNETYERNMRRYKGMCCLERIVDGYHTRAWYPVHDIKKLVYTIADKQCRHDVWKDLTSKGSGFRDVIGHLENCIDPQFPEIVKCRNMWSFRNGVFMAKIYDDLTGDYKSQFYPYDSAEFQTLDPLKVSCKYFDQDFEDFSTCDDWWNIPTPNFSQILDFQRLPEEVQRWAFVLGGRLCYEVGELDGFQVMPFFKGIARSGKSTAINDVFKQFYEIEDVKTLSNNVEKKFGLSSIYDGLLFVGPEIRGSMALEQAEFQSIVSGESVSIAVKHEKAKSLVWTTPGVMAGNEVPGWKDTGGSIIRRLVTFNFVRQVVNADAQLPQKLHAEIPFILQKCVRAYLDYAQHKYRNVGNIWDVLPKYFIDVRKEIEEQVSPLDRYLNSTEVIIDPDVRCPSSVFQDAFMQYAARRCGEKGIKFSVDFTRGPFNTRGITIERLSEYWGGDMYDEDFFVGVNIKETTTM
ncbi:MAG: hypothetical protein CL494_04965 [Actinobacteria bacterium]|mgnify:FL=1|nr:hypothetical protein [Actinomycetota bacterium]|tara:strand:- start:303 stop:2288 length:1986 start_codon:yes stop_codon:yes gene_type:complete